MKSVFLSIFLMSILSFAGNTQTRISTSIAFTKIDVFHGFEYAQQWDRLELYAGFEYGFKRSVLQQHFFPKVKIGTSYFFVQKPKFSLGTTAQFSVATIKYNKTAGTRSTYNDLSCGLRWHYGQRFQIGQTLLVGALWQRDNSALTDIEYKYSTIGYAFQIDFSFSF